MTTELNTEVKAQSAQRGRPVNPESKAQKAIDIFNKLGVTAKRGDVIKELQTQLGLTKNGAATYYQNIKKSMGLVKSKTTEPA